MAHETTKVPGGPTRTVIRNVGMILSGRIEEPILPGDAVVAENGRIAAIGCVIHKVGST